MLCVVKKIVKKNGATIYLTPDEGVTENPMIITEEQEDFTKVLK